jgi:hypothetical protein
MLARVACFAGAFLAAHTALAIETCRYAGTTSYAGKVNVETVAATSNGETTVDVTAKVDARSFGLIDLRYLHEEISTSRDGELQSVAINHRYSLAGMIRRQQWDVFTKGTDGMSAWRTQGNNFTDFQSKHPGFVRHWELTSFGRPWLGDYREGAPERRADLDLPRTAMPPGLGTPLALSFYWVRWAAGDGRAVPVFLPGFKRDARVDVLVTSAGPDTDGLHHLRSTVRHPGLSDTQASTGDAWISPDHHLVRVMFDAHSSRGGAHGELHLAGCEVTP